MAEINIPDTLKALYENEAYIHEVATIATKLTKSVCVLADKHNIDRDIAMIDFAETLAYMVANCTFMNFKINES